MDGMFNYCTNLENLIIPFNTISVQTMKDMFKNCDCLISLDISNFNTSLVTNMVRMFSHCSSMTSFDLTHFDTSKVTEFYKMFCDCFILADLNISNFNTSNAKNMSYMFSDCYQLKYLNLSSFTMEEATNITHMFNNTPKIEGGYGTAYDKNNITAEMAVVDSKTTAGYLNTKSAYQLFNGAVVIGNYETLKDVITAVNSNSLNNLEIVLLADKLETEAVTLSNGKTVTISLEDKTLRIDDSNIFTVSGTLMLNANKGGMILNAEKAFVGTTGSTITLENVSINTTSSSIFTKGNLNVNNSKINTTNSPISFLTIIH
jgi:surface protein